MDTRIFDNCPEAFIKSRLTLIETVSSYDGARMKPGYCRLRSRKGSMTLAINWLQLAHSSRPTLGPLNINDGEHAPLRI